MIKHDNPEAKGDRAQNHPNILKFNNILILRYWLERSGLCANGQSNGLAAIEWNLGRIRKLQAVNYAAQQSRLRAVVVNPGFAKHKTIVVVLSPSNAGVKAKHILHFSTPAGNFQYSF